MAQNLPGAHPLELTKDDLLNSAQFCMMPWIHFHAWPNGKAFPCCTSQPDLPIGDLKTEAIHEIWNGSELRALRRRMLARQASPQCKRCYALEADSETETLRLAANRHYRHHWPSVESTLPDGTVPQVNLAYFDFRFSNICNFRCQTCGPQFSHSWYEDQTLAYGQPDHAKLLSLHSKPGEFFERVKPYLLQVETAYFAGGEPLLCEDHLKILEYWIQQNHTHVRLEYTTNFSQVQFQNRNWLDLWKQFRRVEIFASLDASGARAEYLRKGTYWPEIERNRILLATEAPQVGFSITPTISAYNAFHFPDFHFDWLERGLVKANNIRLNLLTHQDFMSLDIFDFSSRQQLKQLYRKSLDRILALQSVPHPLDRLISAYQSVIQFLERPERPELRQRFWERAAIIDQIRGENLLEIFPELEVLRDYGAALRMTNP